MLHYFIFDGSSTLKTINFQSRKFITKFKHKNFSLFSILLVQADSWKSSPYFRFDFRFRPSRRTTPNAWRSMMGNKPGAWAGQGLARSPNGKPSPRAPNGRGLSDRDGLRLPAPTQDGQRCPSLRSSPS